MAYPKDCATLLEEKSRIPCQIQQMKHIIDAQFATPLSLDVIAEQLGQSKFHLSRMFLSCYHVTPGAYLTGVRMEQATRLLTTTHLSIKRIGCQVGYSNGSYFSSSFKKYYGMTPKEYRDSYQAHP